MRDDSSIDPGDGPLAEPRRPLVRGLSPDGRLLADLLARWVTVNDFFHRSDRPFEEVQPSRRRPTPPPISSRPPPDETPRRSPVEPEHQRFGPDSTPSDRSMPSPRPRRVGGASRSTRNSKRLSRRAGGTSRLEIESRTGSRPGMLARQIAAKGSGGRPGYLVSSTRPAWLAAGQGLASRTRSADLRPEGTAPGRPVYRGRRLGHRRPPALRLRLGPSRRQPRPAVGHSRLGLDPRPDPEQRVDDRRTIDPATGGIRGLQSPIGEETARLGQQLTIGGLVGPDGKPASSRMRGADLRGRLRRPRARAGHHDGTLHDPLDDRRLASFQQRFRLWAGRPTLEIEIQLSDLDPALAGEDRRVRPLDPPPGLPMGLARPAIDPPADRLARPDGHRGRTTGDAGRPGYHLTLSAGPPCSSAAWPTIVARGLGCWTRS